MNLSTATAPGRSTSEFRLVLAAIVIAAMNAGLGWLNPRIGAHLVLTGTERAWLTGASGSAAVALAGLYSTHRTWLKGQLARIEAGGLPVAVAAQGPRLVQKRGYGSGGEAPSQLPKPVDPGPAMTAPRPLPDEPPPVDVPVPPPVMGPPADDQPVSPPQAFAQGSLPPPRSMPAGDTPAAAAAAAAAAVTQP